MRGSTRDSLFTALCVGSGAAGLLLAATLLALGPLPPLLPLVLFGALSIFAEHRSLIHESGASTSAGLMVATAAIVVFVAIGGPAGPVIVAGLGALYLEHLRSFRSEGMWKLVLYNIGGFALPAGAALTVYALIATHVTMTPVMLALVSVPVALVYSTVNLLLLTPAASLRTGERMRDVFLEMRATYAQSIPFALLGVFVGRLYLEVGPIMVPLLVAPILIARQAFSSYVDLKRNNDATVHTLIRALEAKDRYTAGHVERVARFALYVGEQLGFSAARRERLRFAALMHDVGKLVVPNHLLNKPGRLTAEEFAQVREHEHISVEILSRIDFLSPVAESASGDFSSFDTVDVDTDAAIEPFIVAVADAFDAMTSTRSYRRALPMDLAFQELRDKAGTQFHPRVVEALIASIEARGEQYGAGHETNVEEFAVPPPSAGLGSAGLGDLVSDQSHSTGAA